MSSLQRPHDWDPRLGGPGVIRSGDFWPGRAPPPNPALQLHRTHLRRDPPAGEGDRPAARRSKLPEPGVGRTRPRLPGLARHDDGPDRHPPAQPTYATNYPPT